jgi:surface protein
VLVMNGRKVGKMVFGGREVASAWWDGECVWRNTPVVKITNGEGVGDYPCQELMDALAEFGLDYKTVEVLPFRLDTSQVTTMRQMFYGCSSLVEVPQMDTSQVTTMRSMFSGCSSLVEVPAMDGRNLDSGTLTNSSGVAYTFSGTTSLRDGHAHITVKKGFIYPSKKFVFPNSGLTVAPFFDEDGNPV